jgi:hypothetical protein
MRTKWLELVEQNSQESLKKKEEAKEEKNGSLILELRGKQVFGF